MSEDEIKVGSEPDLMGDGDSFDDFESGEGRSLGGFLKNPTVKVGVIVVGVLSIVVGIVLFGGKPKKEAFSVLRGGADLSQAPGTSDISPAMKTAIEDVNKKAAEEAERKQGSAIPIPVQPMRERVQLSDDSETPEDPLERWRRIQEERQTRQSTGKPVQQVDPNAEAIDNLAKAISSQMTQVLSAQKIKEIAYNEVASADYLEGLREDEERERQEKLKEQEAAADSTKGAKAMDVIVPAGTIEYAQLITEANSDAPGPVLAQIVTGPLAGSRILGSFKAEDEYLVISFDTVVIDGISTTMDGVALDPETTNVGMVTDIDHRYFQRIVLPAAAAFVEGMSGAIADAGSTTVTVDGGAAVSSKNNLDAKEETFEGISKAAEKIGEIVDDEGKEAEPLIRVASGTPMAVLFVQPVVEDAKKSAK